MTGKMQVARCSQCSSWLDVRLDKDSEAERQIKTDLEWHLWVAERIMEVLAVMPHTPTGKTKSMISCVLSGSGKLLEETPENCLFNKTKFIQWALLKAFVRQTN